VIAFETSVRIAAPLEDVFAYVSDPRTYPSWNSAVEEVRPRAGSGGTGSSYSMIRQLPTGRASNELEVVGRERPHEFSIRASAGPTPFLYRYRFAGANGKTVVRLDAQVELPSPAAALPQLARRAVKRGVDHNLATLKVILEGGAR
jgi:uncharacterized protein YndB with AHSA1/START domain